MRWRVITTEETQDWYTALEHFNVGDIYFLPEYHRAHELNRDGKAYAWIFEDEAQAMFYPFFMRPINQRQPDVAGQPWNDIETVYGYSGPLSTTSDPAFIEMAWVAFDVWCQENHVIAEFVRFNPFVGNHRCAGASCNITLDRETVVLKLEGTEDELWARYPSSQRTKVRKALKSGMVAQDMVCSTDLDKFEEIYSKTMDHLGAASYYYFSHAYFKWLCTALSNNLLLFAVSSENHTIACALFLLHGDHIHYHLGGSDVAFRESRPNNLLFHQVALWGRERGFRWLHMGGGKTASHDDTLFRFKATISHARLPFYIGRRVHNQPVYDALCAEWMQQHSATERPGYFLLYRLGEGQ